MSASTKLPFFARFLQTGMGSDGTSASRVRTGLQAGRTTKYPSDGDEYVTMKYPSDDDEGGIKY